MTPEGNERQETLVAKGKVRAIVEMCQPVNAVLFLRQNGRSFLLGLALFLKAFDRRSTSSLDRN
jgi:hypothetical protein